jgi:hypothetical protein
MGALAQDNLFECLWNGEATPEERTTTVTGGAAKTITDDIIAIHTLFERSVARFPYKFAEFAA